MDESKKDAITKTLTEAVAPLEKLAKDQDERFREILESYKARCGARKAAVLGCLVHLHKMHVQTIAMMHKFMPDPVCGFASDYLHQSERNVVPIMIKLAFEGESDEAQQKGRDEMIDLLNRLVEGEDDLVIEVERRANEIGKKVSGMLKKEDE